MIWRPLQRALSLQPARSRRTPPAILRPTAAAATCTHSPCLCLRLLAATSPAARRFRCSLRARFSFTPTPATRTATCVNAVQRHAGPQSVAGHLRCPAPGRCLSQYQSGMQATAKGIDRLGWLLSGGLWPGQQGQPCSLRAQQKGAGRHEMKIGEGRGTGIAGASNTVVGACGMGGRSGVIAGGRKALYMKNSGGAGTNERQRYAQGTQGEE